MIPRSSGGCSKTRVGLGPDSNPYRFVGNGPTNGTDPSGLDSIETTDGPQVLFVRQNATSRGAGNTFSIGTHPNLTAGYADVGGQTIPIATLQDYAKSFHNKVGAEAYSKFWKLSSEKQSQLMTKYLPLLAKANGLVKAEDALALESDINSAFEASGIGSVVIQPTPNSQLGGTRFVTGFVEGAVADVSGQWNSSVAGYTQWNSWTDNPIVYSNLHHNPVDRTKLLRVSRPSNRRRVMLLTSQVGRRGVNSKRRTIRIRLGWQGMGHTTSRR